VSALCTAVAAPWPYLASHVVLRNAASVKETTRGGYDDAGPDPRNWSDARVRQWLEHRDSAVLLAQDACFNACDGRTLSAMHVDDIRDYYNKVLVEHARALAEWNAMAAAFDGGSAGALLC